MFNNKHMVIKENMLYDKFHKILCQKVFLDSRIYHFYCYLRQVNKTEYVVLPSAVVVITNITLISKSGKWSIMGTDGILSSELRCPSVTVTPGLHSDIQ